MNCRWTYLIGFFLLGIMNAWAQSDSVRTEYLYIDGQRLKAMITPDDTLFVFEYDSIQISSPRTFKDREEYLLYMRYKRYAAKVYPYAKDAVRIYREADYVTRYMNEKSRKVYLKHLQQELNEKFEVPLKKLSKTQGRILIEMIEREIDMSLFDLIALTRGGFIASYYGTVGTFFDYDIREGYIEGKDPIMDIVIKDLDISYDIEKVIKKNESERMPMIPQ